MKQGWAVLALTTGLAVGSAMLAPAAAQGKPVGAATWDDGLRSVRAMGRDPVSSAPVADLVLQREAGRLTFASGTIVLLRPIEGRTMGAAFKGKGSFTFAPRTQAERAAVARRHGDSTYTVGFSEAVLFFSDTTALELSHRLMFTPGAPPDNGAGLVGDALGLLGDPDEQDLDPDVLLDLFNAAQGGMFYAHLNRGGDTPVMFLVAPRSREGVQLREQNRVGLSKGAAYIAAQEAPAAPGAGRASGDRQGDALVRHYALDVSLPSTGGGDIGFQARARLFIYGEAALGPWIAFQLLDKFEVDSAQWGNGRPAAVEKRKDSPYLWVRLPAPLPAGEVVELTVDYHGDLIDRYGDFFFIESATAWYPRPLDGRSYATFELIYHTPSNYVFASVGELMDSSTVGQVTTSRWVTARPIRNASFNIGFFKPAVPVEPGAPPVTVLVSESGHRSVGSKAYSADEVAADIARSMKLFTTLFGPPPADHFYATEIPALHGEAFPGLIHLSASTFDMSTTRGHEEVFRAHEVAHQWWGIGVDFASYRDQWLSEGFASFAALWYLQTVRGDTKQYFQILDEWKGDIVTRAADAAPISQGYRIADLEFPSDYNTVVYEKGAWVLHMLRALMIDLKSMNEDRFTGMMRDFYQTYRGKQASTADFRRTVERHTGQDMGWFFSQWVDGTALPSYRVAWQVADAPDGKYFVRFRVRQQGVPESFRAYVPIGFEMGKDQWVRVRKQVTGPLTEFEIGPLPAKPKSVKFNDLDGVLAEVKGMAWDG